MAKRRKIKVKSPLYKFLTVVISIVIPAFFIIVACGAGYFYYAYSRINVSNPEAKGKGEDKGLIEQLLSTGPERITIAGFGVDKDGIRTDVMLVGTYNTKSKKINIISIPRDTYIKLDQETWKEMNNRRWTPQVMKMNELHAYAGRENWYKYVIPQLEKMLGLKIDHYLKINTAAFRQIVDAIGGVDFYVPRDMDYEDPYQDLYIHLKEGQQLLNGDQAEQLVRFRKDANGTGYSNGDIGRISMQQEFMKAFTGQVIKKVSIFNLPDLIQAVYDNVETDMPIDNAINYATKYLGSLDLSKMDMQTIPGQARMVDGRSYYVTNEIEVQSYVNNLLIDATEKEKQVTTKDTKEVNSDMERDIQLLNGGNVNGLATKTSDRLQSKGYTIKGIDTYTGIRVDETRIYVKKIGQGAELLKEFTNAEVLVKATEVPNGYDIKVVLGKSEKY